MRILSRELVIISITFLLWSGFSVGQQLPAPGTFTADELNAKANATFKAGDFKTAEGLLLAFERDFGDEPALKEKIETNTALIALCMITNGRGSQAGTYIKRALKISTLPVDVLEELSFWDAVIKLQNEQFREAQESLGKFFQNRQFDYSRRLEALALFGTCYSLQGYHKTAADFFDNQIPNLRKAKGGEAYAARAVVLQMLSLIQSEQYDSALDLLKREYPNLDQLDQIVSFQTLALSLGSHYMDSRDYFSAIACLQRIWPKQKLLTHQQEKLTALQTKREALASNPRAQSQLFQVDGTIKRVQRELDNFSKIQDFDAALRLRLAIAFQSLGRYREAALIMEDMLQRMEPSPVVESASLAVIQCWSQLERWPKALQAAENYLQSFGDDKTNKNLPQVLFMQADAMMQQQQLADAEAVFINIADSFPKHQLAARAIFMSGFAQLQQDKNEQALATFDTVLKKIDAKDSLAQDAFYWKGMAYSFTQQYDLCFQQMEQYLKKYKSGLKYESEAEFRKAYCTFCNADYPGAIKQFQQFLLDHGPSAPDRDEALLLLGDALLAEGDADKGIASYALINPESQRFFEDGVFKTGKAYKLLEEPEKMRSHYQQFLANFPDSKRMPEAVYWIGWTYVHAGEIDKAKEVYWQTINEHGNNPELFSIEELLLGLPKVYKRDGPRGMASLERALQKLHIQAGLDKKNTLAMRGLWAEAMILQQGEDSAKATSQLVKIAKLIDPKVHNPVIIADVADALATKKQYDTAEKLYEDLRKWNPVSFHKARAYKGLGLIAEQQKRYPDAIRQYKNYEKAAAASTDLATIQLKRIQLEMAEGNTGDTMQELESLLENPVTSTQQKAQTLFLIGEILSDQKQYLKATAYYERVYLVYGKYIDLVAKSYYRRGEALEALGENTKAYEVYAELYGRTDLKGLDESGFARKKLTALEAYAPEPTQEEAAE